MRALPILLLTMLSACASPETNAPSLAPRAAEAIDPRVPVPDPVISMTPAAGLVDQLNKLVAQALAGDQAFQTLIARAEELASAAGIDSVEFRLRGLTDTRAIDNFIVRLRRYIEDEPSHPKHLLTVRGVGYRFLKGE